MPVLFITFGLSLALGVIRLLLRGVGSCLALIVTRCALWCACLRWPRRRS